MKHIVFYDAQCPFCYYVKKWVQRLDWNANMKWVSVQEVYKNGRYPYLEGRPLLDEIHLLTDQGKVVEGFHSIRFILLQLPLFFMPGLLLYLPGMKVWGVRLYKWFSSRRYEWFGQYDQPRYD
ncbi:hypothetical protein GCM10010954_19060 [Halobacillus andaensis]|uniref:DUF393 domain-containing protein n=1 Tax=Halobacillus andaensis TaxID=1176239 RepID=A0A917B5N6_HALAA|nr:putative DCC family thiol-disulfide oxidoreductase YuxK [Halobacillus andaensis]GGF20513.1 hypothetical protein GCM10010954_19060 [Halobacillus andaensis]